jgi:hypothetical protein
LYSDNIVRQTVVALSDVKRADKNILSSNLQIISDRSYRIVEPRNFRRETRAVSLRSESEADSFVTMLACCGRKNHLAGPGLVRRRHTLLLAAGELRPLAASQFFSTGIRP